LIGRNISEQKLQGLNRRKEKIILFPEIGEEQTMRYNGLLIMGAKTK